MLQDDVQIMRRCLQLARNGEGNVAPNPMVGAVIVHNGQVIGEGYHTKFGAPHAEPMAISSVADKSLLPQSTIYVSLEPCCHYGKTPPCAQLICNVGIPKVVVATTDPFHKVNGGGIEILRKQGVEVVVGVLENEARELNKFFFTYHEKKHPYIILKWAESADGFIDSNRIDSEQPIKISGATSHKLVHRWRTQVQSIMVGTNTVLRDNSRLTARSWAGKNPLRIVMDRSGRIPFDSMVFNDEAETLLFVSKQTNHNYGSFTNQIEISFDNNLEQNLLDELYKRQIQSLFIEGGAQLINRFIIKGLWDEARVFIGNVYLRDGVMAPIMPNINPIALSIIQNDKLLVFRQNNL